MGSRGWTAFRHRDFRPFCAARFAMALGNADPNGRGRLAVYDNRGKRLEPRPCRAGFVPAEYRSRAHDRPRGGSVQPTVDPDHRLFGHDADLARPSHAGPCGRAEALADLRSSCGGFRGSPSLPAIPRHRQQSRRWYPGGGSCERHRLEFIGHAGCDDQRAGGRGILYAVHPTAPFIGSAVCFGLSALPISALRLCVLRPPSGSP